MITAEQVSAKMFGHLGIVAATIDKLGIVEKIDALIPLGSNSKTSIGERVKAMILNGLGFVDTRLYMFPEFLEGYPIQRLFGREDISASDFNDAALGRGLDEIADYGITRTFSTIAMSIGRENGLLGRSSNVDTTSLSVYGDYEGCDEKDVAATDVEVEPKEIAAEEEDADVQAYLEEADVNPWPRYGFAKNKRHDLKQMVLNLATTGKAGFPIWMEAHSGNASDKKIILEAGKRLNQLCRSIKDAPEFLTVGDSAMYDACMKDGGETLWLTRVPETHGLAREMVESSDSKFTWTEIDENYKISCVEKVYKKIIQRWCLVFSRHAYKREIATFDRRLKADLEQTTKGLWHLGNQQFGCMDDAQRQLKIFRKTLKWHDVANVKIVAETRHQTPGRPQLGAKPDTIVGYKITGTVEENKTKTEVARARKGRFILATNQLNKDTLPDTAMISEYKDQSKTERGFKFIKDNTFEVSSVFLKKPKRIAALMMVMTLCLMVYAFVQHYIREELKAKKETIPNQRKKEIDNPTATLVFRTLHRIQIVRIQLEDGTRECVANLNELRTRIIKLFGPVAMRIYGIT
jgi:transposase